MFPDASFLELYRFLLSAPNVRMTERECEALASDAMNGDAEAEFTIGSFFDVADETSKAVEWYSRSANQNYLPAMLQLCAVR